MKITDLRNNHEEQGYIIDVEQNNTINHERVILTLDTGFKVEIWKWELNKIRPIPTPK